MKLKKTLAAALVLTMVFSFFAVTGVAAVDFEGDGTAGSPLQIGTAEQLLEFAARVNSSETDLCAVLTDNITVNGEWATIGHHMTGSNNAAWILENSNPYTGTFDGGGYTLTLSKTGIAGALQNVGVALFHTVGTGGVIRDVNLNVNFEGRRYIAGAAVYNYGTIEYVTVEGSITAGVSATTNAAGIVAYNGCKTVGGVLVPGKILHCVNKAEISVDASQADSNFVGVEKYGGQIVGGICANFLGEMRYCANLGNVWTLSNSSIAGGSLFGLREVKSGATQEMVVISDCYNVGNVYILSQSGAPNYTYGGLFGVFYESNILNWITSGKVKVSDTFNYGLVRNPYPEINPNNVDGTHIIIGFGNSATFNDTHVNYIFSNIYYRPEIGGTLFGQFTESNGSDGYGTEPVKQRIIGKTAAEFNSAALATALNAGRVGAEAPWEYVEGNDYPTLKFERADYDPVNDAETAEYTLMVTADENGFVSSSGGSYTAGEEITVNAAAYSGYRFKEWTAEGVTLDTPTANPLTFTMPANAVTLTAAFEADEPIPSTIDAAFGYGGEITFSDDKYTVSATANSYVIDEIWVDGVKLENVQGQTTFELTAAPARSIFATFGYTINFPNPANGSLSVSRGSTELTSGSIVYAGEVLTITATAAAGYELDAENTVFGGLTPVDGEPGKYTVTALRTNPPSITVVFKETAQTPGEEPVDKTALDAAITAANTKVEADYTPNSWSAFQSALTTAQAVADNTSATQEQVTNAENALTGAIDALVPRADKTALTAAVASAAAYTESEYTPESWQTLTTALTAAQDVLADDEATAGEVASAVSAINAAIAGLAAQTPPEVPIDKTALDAAITAANEKVEADYTPNSWSALQSALTTAQAVTDNDSATQEQATNAANALTAATDALVPRADKTALTEAITAASALRQADYTSSSWTAFANALTAAQSVLGNDDAAQTAVNTAAANLTAAKNALVSVPPPNHLS
jgi:hypothetical protein